MATYCNSRGDGWDINHSTCKANTISWRRKNEKLSHLPFWTFFSKTISLHECFNVSAKLCNWNLAQRTEQISLHTFVFDNGWQGSLSHCKHSSNEDVQHRIHFLYSCAHQSFVHKPTSIIYLSSKKNKKRANGVEMVLSSKQVLVLSRNWWC